MTKQPPCLQVRDSFLGPKWLVRRSPPGRTLTLYVRLSQLRLTDLICSLHVQAWLIWSERETVNPQVVGSMPYKTRELWFHGFELHRPSNKGTTKLLLKVIQAIIIVLFLEQPWLRWRNAERQRFFFEICDFLWLISKKFLFNLEMNGSDVVAERSTHLPQLFIWRRKEEPAVGTQKLGKELQRIREKIWPCLCQILFSSCSNLPAGAPRPFRLQKNDVQCY